MRHDDGEVKVCYVVFAATSIYIYKYFYGYYVGYCFMNKTDKLVFTGELALYVQSMVIARGASVCRTAESLLLFGSVSLEENSNQNQISPLFLLRAGYKN